MNFEKQYVFDPEEAGRTARVTLGVQGGQVRTRRLELSSGVGLVELKGPRRV
jgi:hypothetical protein